MTRGEECRSKAELAIERSKQARSKTVKWSELDNAVSWYNKLESEAGDEFTPEDYKQRDWCHRQISRL